MKLILFITTVITALLLIKMSKLKNKNVLGYYVTYSVLAIFISNFAVFLQYLFLDTFTLHALSKLEPLIVIPISILTTLFLLISIIFTNIKRSNSATSFLFLVPIISSFFVATNDIHHLMFVNYSFDYSQMTYGPAFHILLIYSIICLLISYILYITILVKEHNDFSITANYVYMYSIIPISVFLIDLIYKIGLPKGFLSILCVPVAFILTHNIYKQKTINVTEIANDDIFNKMQSSHIILDYNNMIVQDNYKFDTKFNLAKNSKNVNYFIDKMITWNKNKLISNILFNDIIYKLDEIATNHSKATVEFDVTFKGEDSYFVMDFLPILSELRKHYVGCLVTITDVTKQKNELFTIAQDQEMIINQQHLATIGELTSGFAHDINTPLSAMQTALSIIKYNPKLNNKGKNTVENMEKSIFEISSFSSNVRTQLRNIDAVTSDKFPINSAIYNIIQLSKTEANKSNCTILFNPDKEIYLKGNSSKFSQVISNIIINAIQAYENEGGEISVITQKNKSNIQISISDKAGGLPEKIQYDIFKKILSTDKENGNGLGLYISYSIIKNSFNGSISFLTKPNYGTTFTITIPVTKEEN